MNLTEEQLSECRTWFKFQRRLKKFSNNCTVRDFNIMFGEENGERLLKHHREFGMDFHKFQTYLTSEQVNAFYEYVLNNFAND